MGRGREGWGSRLGVILAVAGSAVGLGNFLRFPGLAAKYGGGVFLIPYLVALLLLGIPICWAEWTIGRYGGRRGYNGAPGIFSAVTGWRHGHFLGVLGLLIPIVVFMYYVYIEAWCFAYTWSYLTGALDLGKDPAAYGRFFEDLVGVRGDGVLLDGGLHAIVVWLALCFAVNFLIIYRGIARGIERFCIWAMPALIACAFIVLVRVLTLGTPDPSLPEQNVVNGLGFMWNPKIPEGGTLLRALANPELWLQATGQIFFSLSVGFGIVMTYASYLRERDDLVLSSMTASATNEFCEVCLGGLITIPAAFLFLGADPIQKVAGSTLGLGFYTIPVVFEYMPAGSVFGFLWFLLLALAALTSSLSMLQPAIAFLEESFHLSRHVAVAALGATTALGTLFVVYWSGNLAALDAMDFWVGQVGIFLLGTVLCIVFGWVVGVEQGVREAERGALVRLPRWFPFVIKYVSPTYLLAVLAGFLWKDAGGYARKVASDPAAAWTIAFIAGLALVLFALVARAGPARAPVSPPARPGVRS
jgi:neurotransmitter:Na+ symporter, NSS family